MIVQAYNGYKLIVYVTIIGGANLTFGTLGLGRGGSIRGYRTDCPPPFRPIWLIYKGSGGQIAIMDLIEMPVFDSVLNRFHLSKQQKIAIFSAPGWGFLRQGGQTEGGIP